MTHGNNMSGRQMKENYLKKRLRYVRRFTLLRCQIGRGELGRFSLSVDFRVLSSEPLDELTWSEVCADIS